MLNNEQQALNDLKTSIEEMMHSIITQLDRSKELLENNDIDLAREVLAMEKKINSSELRIEKSCENILALYQPVATDLRLVLAALSITTQLERIGDHAKGMAAYVVEGHINKPYAKEILQKVKFSEMFEIAMSMIDDATYGFINEDTKILKWVFTKDDTLNKTSNKSSQVISDIIKI